MSRRVQKNVFEWQTDHWSLNTEYRYVYDGWNLIREQTTGGTTSTEYYVWGLDLSGTLQGAGGIGGLLSTTNSLTSTTYLYTVDANGNIGQLVDSSTGTIAAHYEYDPFGNLLVSTGSEADKNVFRFSTKYYDAETGLYYYGYRYYDPVLGRWWSREPIGEENGLNLYGFVDNNPINWIDFLGLWTKEGVLKILCQDPEGRKFVEDILSRYAIYSYESYTYKRQYYKDAAKVEKIGQPREYPIRGYHSRQKMEMGVEVGLSDEAAASTFYHEAVHGLQYDKYDEELIHDPNAKFPPIAEREYESHILQEQFNIQHNIPPKHPTFRKQDEKGNWISDEEAIKRWVDDVYGFRKTDYYTNYDFKKIGVQGPMSGWCCPGCCPGDNP